MLRWTSGWSEGKCNVGRMAPMTVSTNISKDLDMEAVRAVLASCQRFTALYPSSLKPRVRVYVGVCISMIPVYWNKIPQHENTVLEVSFQTYTRGKSMRTRMNEHMINRCWLLCSLVKQTIDSLHLKTTLNVRQHFKWLFGLSSLLSWHSNILFSPSLDKLRHHWFFASSPLALYLNNLADIWWKLVTRILECCWSQKSVCVSSSIVMYYDQIPKNRRPFYQPKLYFCCLFMVAQ